MKEKEGKKTTANNLMCPHCPEGPFARSYTLKKHVARKHKEVTDADLNTTGSCVCHRCGYCCRRIVDLRKHLASQHGVIFHYEDHFFENKEGNDSLKKEIAHTIHIKSSLHLGFHPEYT